VRTAIRRPFEGKMRAVSRTAAILLAAALTACAHAPGPAGAPPGPAPVPKPLLADPTTHFPLAVGNEWTWLDLSPQSGNGAPKRRTVRIVGRDAEGFFVDSEKGALRSAHGCIEDRSRRILCAPFDVDRAWTSIVSETSTERYQVGATGVTATVPAGTFEGCVLVRARNRAGADAEILLETTYAPGVGPVRIETFALVGGRKVPQVRAELASYRMVRPGK
jgi:hypothetical protein